MHVEVQSSLFVVFLIGLYLSKLYSFFKKLYVKNITKIAKLQIYKNMWRGNNK